MKNDSFGDVFEGGDFFSAWKAMAYGSSTLKEKKLPAPEPVPAIPSRTGSSAPVPLPGTTGSGGIASPLTESSYAERVYYAAKNVTTTDGLFTMNVRHLQQISLLDANNAAVVMKFKDKP